MSALARLTELGLTLPAVATPAGAYIPARRSGTWCSPRARSRSWTGRSPRPARSATPSPPSRPTTWRICTLNALAAIDGLVGLDSVTGVVKVVGFVASDPAFTGQPGVINGASDLLGEVFGEAGAHARSAVGVAVLPLDVPVEVELTVEIED